ncbi:MAG: penicillin-binding protein 2 [Acidimicrobiales bacterium]|nr:penicillin-binding protein 2 [Acidimicrobiales bacterium]
MNRQIRRLGIALMVCYAVLFVQLNWVQVLRADDYLANPANTRPIVDAFSRPRGSIQTADGVIVAESVEVDGRFQYLRTYPQGPLFSQVTGWFSFTYGADGAEASYNQELSGEAVQSRGWADLFLERTRREDLTLSVRADVQQAAAAALGERQGSVVALDPRTGAVLALWSWPTYDPNLLSSHDLEAVQQARDLLLADPAKPLLPKTYRERYFPGSTFKVVTAAAGLESGEVTPTSPSYPVTREYTPPLTTTPIRNFGGSACGGTLFTILAVSCNTAFAQMGVDLGAEVMVERARAFGFDAAPPLDLPVPARSAYPSVAFFDENDPALAQSAIGQNDVAATPLQMALVAAAVANEGVVMTPHVGLDLRDDEGRLVGRIAPGTWRRALSSEHAATLRDAMVGVVDNGTAGGLAIPGVTVAGKTGTAQLGTEPPASHAWVVAFAPAEAPRVAVAVIVEGLPGASEQTGGRVAAPIARAVLEVALAAPDPLGRGG